VVLDDLTKAEELCSKWVVDNVKTEKGHEAKGIEGYGFGKGFTHLYEAFLPLLGDLDAHVRAGRQVVCVAHECTANVPNPHGEDWIRYEPRLQSPPSGKNSVRHRVKEWADHLIFIGYDVARHRAGQGDRGRDADHLPGRAADAHGQVPLPVRPDRVRARLGRAVEEAVRRAQVGPPPPIHRRRFRGRVR
jgi:hypothetical protein